MLCFCIVNMETDEIISFCCVIVLKDNTVQTSAPPPQKHNTSSQTVPTTSVNMIPGKKTFSPSSTPSAIKEF